MTGENGAFLGKAARSDEWREAGMMSEQNRRTTVTSDSEDEDSARFAADLEAMSGEEPERLPAGDLTSADGGQRS
jgi:hypothetical protein